MVDLIITEPSFNDSSQRCFKLPYVATQAFCINNEDMVKMLFEDPQNELLNALFKFVEVPEEV